MSGHNIKVVRGGSEHRREHVFAQEHLPWHVTGKIDPLQARRVSEHLEVCAECRRDFAFESKVAQSIDTAPVIDLVPQAGLAKVMARIESRTARRDRFARWFRPWVGERAHRPLVFAVAIQAAVIVMLTGGLVSSLTQREPSAPQPVTSPVAQPIDGSSDNYRTLSNQEPSSRAGAKLRLVLDETLSLAEIHEMLAPLNGSIVAGPGENGLLTVQVSGDLQQAVQSLRAKAGVRLAEVVLQ